MIESQPTRSWNLLTEPILRVITNQGRKRMNLPQLLAALGHDEVHHYEGIQRHQEDAFHVFLCNLAAAILGRYNEINLVQCESYWRRGLRELAESSSDDAWILIVNDPSRPAFMQPPLSLTRFTINTECSDAVDALQLARNHDVKNERAYQSEPDTWVYALISCHFNAGYSIGGPLGFYFPTLRRKSNYSGRVYVYVAPVGPPGKQWRYCTERVISERRRLLKTSEWPYDRSGIVLTWLPPWDGQTSLKLRDLDPTFIEITRAVRLRLDEGKIIASLAPTKTPRIFVPKELSGNIGDPWVPVDLENGSALSVTEGGWKAGLLRRIIFADGIQCTSLQKAQTSEQGTFILKCASLARSKRGTEGYQTQYILIPNNVLPRIWGTPRQSNPLDQLSRNAIEYAGKMEHRVLKPAVFAFLQGGSEKIDYDRTTVNTWWSRLSKKFNAGWSDDYFPWLWSVPEPIDQEVALRDWTLRLRKYALETLRQAKDTMPQHSGRRFRSRSRAELAFRGLLYRTFPLLKEVEHAKSTTR